jgi:hypothetical protein
MTLPFVFFRVTNMLLYERIILKLIFKGDECYEYFSIISDVISC